MGNGTGSRNPNSGDGSSDGPFVVQNAAARTGLQWCGTQRHDQVFGDAAHGGTDKSLVVRHAAA